MYREILDMDTELVFPLPGDAEELFALVDRERDRLGKWLTRLEQVKSVEDQRAFLRSLGEAIGHGNAYRYLVRVKGQLAGLLALKILLSGHTGEIGYWLRLGLRGQGHCDKRCGFPARRGL